MTDGVAGPPRCRGHVELTVDGHLDGWCWNPATPNRRVVVDMTLNGRRHAATVAALYRGDLKALGRGDGYSGFRFPMPTVGERPAGQTVIEVRARPNGDILGRFIFGEAAVDPAVEARIADIEAAMDACRARADKVAPRTRSYLPADFSEIGRGLLHQARRGTRTDADAAAPTLMLSTMRERLSSIPTLVLDSAAAPAVSLIFLARGAVGELAEALRSGASALSARAAEYILIDDGSEPLAALLPTRLRNLRLVKVFQDAGTAAALNEAALLARGHWLAIVSDPWRFNGFALDEALGAVGDTGLLLAAAARGGLPDAGLSSLANRVERREFRSGLMCLIERTALMQAGGFVPDRHDQERPDWADLAEKCLALGCPVTAWVEPRPFRG